MVLIEVELMKDRHQHIVIHPFNPEWYDRYAWCTKQFGHANRGRWNYDCDTAEHDCYSFKHEADKSWFILRWGIL